MRETFKKSLGIGTDRSPHDYYPTPPVATFALSCHESLPGSVLEPCSGRGHVVAELRRLGHRVVARDLYAYPDPLVDDVETGIDFLESPGSDCEAVVTNPPYGDRMPERFLCQAMGRYNYVAFLCRLSWLEGKRRFDIFDSYPLSRVLVLSRRINCDDVMIDQGNQLGGMVPYAWYVWDYREERPSTTELVFVDMDLRLEEWKAQTSASITAFMEDER